MGLKERLKRAWQILRETVDLWSAKNAFQLAGALAFYTLFSLAPLLIILTTLAGTFLGEEAVRGEISLRIADTVGPQAAEAVEDAIRSSRIEEAGRFPTLLGVAALLFGATTVFAQLHAALNRIWGVTTRSVRSGLVNLAITRLLSLALVIAIGLLLLASFVTTMATAAFLRYATRPLPLPPGTAATAELLASLAVTTALFALIFKLLPDVKLAWRHAIRGALLTAILFVLGQHLISLYLTRMAPASTYGAAGSLVLLLMWVYYSALLLFFGAAYTKVSTGARGVVVEPRGSAVRIDGHPTQGPSSPS
jgi:membrane protein